MDPEEDGLVFHTRNKFAAVHWIDDVSALFV